MSIVAISTLSYLSGGTSGANTITFTNNTNVSLGQIITGTGIPATPATYVVNINGNILTLSQNLISAAIGTYYTYATSATQTGINVALGKIAFSWKGVYSAGTTYANQDIAYYNGSSYVCLVDGTIAQTPATLTAYWQLFTQGSTSISSSAGEVIYNTGSGLVALPAGTSGQVLTINSSGLPSWGTSDTRSGTKVRALVSNGMAMQTNQYRQNFVIMTDGSIKAWGYNGNDNLGDGTTISRSYPVRAAFPSGFTGALKVWGNFQSNAMCIDTLGQFWIWGYNAQGICGTGGTALCTVPYNASANPSNSINGKIVVDVALGCGNQTNNTMFVLCSDGTVHTSGYNGYGQCGDNTTTNRVNFGRVGTLSGVVKISANRESYMSCHAVTSTGVLWSWGYNGDAELGDGTTTNRYLPVQQVSGVMASKFIYDVNGGYQSTYALARSTVATATAVYVSGGAAGATTITLASVAGVVVNQMITGTGAQVATTANVSGGVYINGLKHARVTAINGNTITLSSPLTVQAAGTYSFYQAGYYGVWGVGDNVTYGAYGNGNFLNTNVPVLGQPSSDNPIEEIYSTNYDYPVSWHRKADNTWWVCGAGNYGANLDPANSHRSSWVQIAPAGVNAGNPIVKVLKSGTGSYNWMAALDKNGAVYTWGYNGNSVLGDGTTTNRDLGTIVKPPINIRTVKDIAIHGASSEQNLVMLMDDGQLWITGYGGSYSNTDNNGNNFATPQPVMF